ncbi:MAG TPA: GspMb/PilO family protein [Terriglobales bacterium]|nr:GspMb/PilO family protein [Terriglobales bacterium]
MPDLRDTRRKVKIALAALAAADVVLVVVFFSPLIGSEGARHQQLDQAWKQLQQKTREVEPLRGLDKKIPIARKQIDQFYAERLPAQDSAISTDLGKVAAQSGVKIGSIKYSMKEGDMAGVQRVEIEADLAGDYLQLVRFINALERDQMFFLVDSVSLGGEQGGVVKLQLKLETYLKTGVA